MKKAFIFILLIIVGVSTTAFFNLSMLKKRYSKRGINNGHFDLNIYHGPITPAISASTTITVSTTGQTSPFPATLGAITTDAGATTVVRALTVSDIVNGFSTDANAQVIRNLVGGDYTATRIGSVVTIMAPAGILSYNGKALSVAPGTFENPLSPTVYSSPPTAPANGQIVISDVSRNRSDVFIRCGVLAIFWGSSANSTTLATRLDDMFTKLNGALSFGYASACTKNGSPTSSLTCNISAPVGVSACSAGFTTNRLTLTANTGPSGGFDGIIQIPQSGWTDLSPAISVGGALSGAAEAVVAGNTCSNGTARCSFRRHKHEYDDQYNRSGVNFLDASDPGFNLSVMIPNMGTQFKVLMHNQYLSPGAKFHIGNASYSPTVDAGYISVKDYQTTATLDLATVTTFTRSTIGSLAINLPQNIFDNNDWWAGALGLPADVRDGLHPTDYGCVVTGDSSTLDGNMYQPVVPPGSVTADGNGTPGWNAGTTQTTASGLRHNGALTIQIIKDTTTNSDIEQSIPGRPEYGWRVKAASFSTYVIGEYTIYHHTKHLDTCYGGAGWTKAPGPDTRPCGPADDTVTRTCTNHPPTLIGTDPQIGTPL